MKKIESNYNKLIYYDMLKELIKNINSKKPGSPIVAAIHDGKGIKTASVNGKSGYLEKVSQKENVSRQDPEQHAEAICLRNLSKSDLVGKKILILIPPCLECYKKLSSTKTNLDVEFLIPYHLKIRENEYKEYNNYGKKITMHLPKAKNKVELDEKKMLINEMWKYFIDYKKNTFILRNLETNGIRNKLGLYKDMGTNFAKAINIFFMEDVFVRNESYDYWVKEGMLEIWAKAKFGKEIRVEYPKDKEIKVDE